MTDIPCPDCQDEQHLCWSHKLLYWRTEGTMQLDPRATPSRKNTAAPRKATPNWERGIVTDQRPDGSRMPLLDGSWNPIRVKAHGENRRQLDDRIRQLKSPTNPPQ